MGNTSNITDKQLQHIAAHMETAFDKVVMRELHKAGTKLRLSHDGTCIFVFNLMLDCFIQALNMNYTELSKALTQLDIAQTIKSVEEGKAL